MTDPHRVSDPLIAPRPKGRTQRADTHNAHSEGHGSLHQQWSAKQFSRHAQSCRSRCSSLPLNLVNKARRHPCPPRAKWLASWNYQLPWSLSNRTMTLTHPFRKRISRLREDAREMQKSAARMNPRAALFESIS